MPSRAGVERFELAAIHFLGGRAAALGGQPAAVPDGRVSRVGFALDHPLAVLACQGARAIHDPPHRRRGLRRGQSPRPVSSWPSSGEMYHGTSPSSDADLHAGIVSSTHSISPLEGSCVLDLNNASPAGLSKTTREVLGRVRPQFRSNLCLLVVQSNLDESTQAELGAEWRVRRVAGHRAGPVNGSTQVVAGLLGPIADVDGLALALSTVLEDEDEYLGVVLVESDLEDLLGVVQVILTTMRLALLGVQVSAADIVQINSLRNALDAAGYSEIAFDGERIWATPLECDPRIAQIVVSAIEKSFDAGVGAREALLARRVDMLNRTLDSALADNAHLRAAHHADRATRGPLPASELLPLQHELSLIYASRAWRVTKPLRRANETWVRLRRRLRRERYRAPSLVAEKSPNRVTPNSLASIRRDRDLLDIRLRTILKVLGNETSVGGEALDKIVAASVDTSRKNWWLLYIGYVGSLPSDTDLNPLVELARTNQAEFAIMRLRVARAKNSGRWQTTAPLTFHHGVVLDATFAATTALHTGVQRVVRSSSRHLVERGAMPVVLDRQAGVWRRTTIAESKRLLEWDDSLLGVETDDETKGEEVVVPWDATVIIPELRPLQDLEVLRCAAGARVATFTAIVYDMIPITMAEWVPQELTGDFGRYLAMVKRFARVAAISESTAREFRGFNESLSPQGCRGPEVRAIRLPLVMPPTSQVGAAAEVRRLRLKPSLPLVLQVGSIAPHKNQGATLEAARKLWGSKRDSFELMFVAPNEWQSGAFYGALLDAKRSGNPVSVVSGIKESVLWQLYRDARVSLLPSLVEGYGLPIVESLSVGTPVITSNFGSMSEIAGAGGGILVAPDIDSIADAISMVLNDEGVYEGLRCAAADRGVSTWAAYAEQIWTWLVDGVEVTVVE